MMIHSIRELDIYSLVKIYEVKIGGSTKTPLPLIQIIKPKEFSDMLSLLSLGRNVTAKGFSF